MICAGMKYNGCQVPSKNLYDWRHQLCYLPTRLPTSLFCFHLIVKVGWLWMSGFGIMNCVRPQQQQKKVCLVCLIRTALCYPISAGELVFHELSTACQNIDTTVFPHSKLSHVQWFYLVCICSLGCRVTANRQHLALLSCAETSPGKARAHGESQSVQQNTW